MNFIAALLIANSSMSAYPALAPPSVRAPPSPREGWCGGYWHPRRSALRRPDMDHPSAVVARSTVSAVMSPASRNGLAGTGLPTACPTTGDRARGAGDRMDTTTYGGAQTFRPPKGIRIVLQPSLLLPLIATFLLPPTLSRTLALGSWRGPCVSHQKSRQALWGGNLNVGASSDLLSISGILRGGAGALPARLPRHDAAPGVFQGYSLQPR